MSSFAFLPYFPVASFDQRFGRIHFFNFTRFGEQFIPDAEMRGRIDEYCSLYMDSNHRRLNNLTIAVIDENYKFDNLTDEQETDLYRYSIALLFCSVIKNIEQCVCVSEQFNLVLQPFIVQGMTRNDFITFQTGSLLRTLNTQTLITARFVKPSFVPNNTSPYRFDMFLMSAMARMIDSHNPIDVGYFRVLDWVRYAYLNADEYSTESRLVMLATAFEIFFDLPDRRKADRFASRLEELLEVDKMDIYDEEYHLVQTGLPQVTKPNARGIDKTNTMYGWWARDFYDLRSKIVHGSVISNQDIRNHKDEQHFFIALKILRFCFYKRLENKGHLTYKTSLEDFSYERFDAEKRNRAIEKIID